MVLNSSSGTLRPTNLLSLFTMSRVNFVDSIGTSAVITDGRVAADHGAVPAGHTLTSAGGEDDAAAGGDATGDEDDAAAGGDVTDVDGGSELSSSSSPLSPEETLSSESLSDSD